MLLCSIFLKTPSAPGKTPLEETGKGVGNPSSAARFYAISEELHRKGAQGVILGCAEIRMLMRRLKKSERKLVLRLLNTRGLLAVNAAFDSFACGFRLALELTTESQQHQKERSEEALTVLCVTEEDES